MHSEIRILNCCWVIISVECYGSDRENNASVCCGLSSKNGSVMSLSQRPGLSGSLEAHTLIQEHAYSIQQYSATLVFTKAQWYSFQFNTERHWMDVFIQILYIQIQPHFPCGCLWGLCDQRFLFRNLKKNVMIADSSLQCLWSPESGNYCEIWDCIGRLSECTSGQLKLREAIVSLSPHSHEFVNRHEARPVASSQAEQWHFPVERALTGLRRQRDTRNKAMFNADVKKRRKILERHLTS